MVSVLFFNCFLLLWIVFSCGWCRAPVGAGASDRARRPAPGADPPAPGPGRALAPGAWRNPKFLINPTAFLVNLQNAKNKIHNPCEVTNKSTTGKSQEIIRCTHTNTCLFVHIAKKRTGWSTCPQEYIQNKSVEFVYFLRLFAKTRGQVDLSVQTNQTNK